MTSLEQKAKDLIERSAKLREVSQQAASQSMAETAEITAMRNMADELARASQKLVEAFLKEQQLISDLGHQNDALKERLSRLRETQGK